MNFHPDIAVEVLVRLLNPIQLTFKCILARKEILQCSYHSFFYASTNNLLTHTPLKIYLKSMPIFTQNLQNCKFYHNTSHKSLCCKSVDTNVMRVGPKVSVLTYKSRVKWKILRGIYRAIYGEVNVSLSVCVEIKGDYIEKQQSWFISVTLKSWSGRKLLDQPS